MSCSTGIISGQDALLQIGRESDWGTPVAATMKLPFTSESLKFVPNYKESEALVGAKSIMSMEIMSSKANGSFTTYIGPDEAGLLMWLCLGRAQAPVQDGTEATAYHHYLTPVSAGADNCLGKATIEIDRLAEQVQYVSMKVNTWKLTVKPEDYLMLDIDWIGRDEKDNTTDTFTMTTGLTLSSKEYFKFINGALYLDQLVSDYSVSGTKKGIAGEAVADVPTSLTGGAGFEIYVLGQDWAGTYRVFKYIGSAITRLATTLTFADAPVSDDEIMSIHSSAGIFNGDSWAVYEAQASEVTSLTLSGENGLQDNKFGLNGSSQMIEINPTKRKYSMDIEATFTNKFSQIRHRRFKTGDSGRIVLNFNSPDMVAGSQPYEMNFEFPKIYFTDISGNVSGPDEINVSGKCEAATPTDYYASIAGSGKATETFACTKAAFVRGDKIEAVDQYGDKHVYEYLGDPVTVAADTVTFTDSATVASSEIESIYTSSDVLNIDYWKILDVITVELVDANSSSYEPA